jgi:hypothetical protein
VLLASTFGCARQKRSLRLRRRRDARIASEPVTTNSNPVIDNGHVLDAPVNARCVVVVGCAVTTAALTSTGGTNGGGGAGGPGGGGGGGVRVFPKSFPDRFVPDSAVTW